jgi:hypothetical protein
VLILLYPELLKASEPATPDPGRYRRPPRRNHPPPGRLRSRVARTLAITASRLDRETARRAVV